MNRNVLKLFLLCAAMFVCAAAFAQHSFTVNTYNVVGQGENFAVTFVADGQVDKFEPPAFTGASVLAGPSTSTSRQYNYVNGKSSSSYQVTYTYVLNASEAGKIQISSASATIEGKVYSTQPVTVEVVQGASASGSQSQGSTSVNVAGNTQQQSEISDQEASSLSKNDLFLRLYLNKTKVVKGEPIVATLKLYTRGDVVGFEDIKFPSFNGFWSQEFDTPSNINFQRENVGNQIYHSAVLRRYVIIPQQTGTLNIEPSEMVVQCRVEQKNSSRNFFDDFFDTGSYSIVKRKLTTGRQSVSVAGLPSGEPASFGGGVGRFAMKVWLSKDSLHANEAASLSVEISGSGNLNLIEAPQVTLPADFERYDTKTTNSFTNGADGASGKKTFEIPFIPRSEGEYEIPAVEYSYYDIAQKKYVTLTSAPKVLKVSKGTGKASSTYIPSASQRQVSNLGEDIRYIRSGKAALRPQGKFYVNSWVYYLLLLIVLVAFISAVQLIKRRIAHNGDILRTKSRRANKVARNRLRRAQGYLGQNKAAEFYEELHKALLGYIGDKLAIQMADLQSDNIEETLKNKGVEQTHIQEFMTLLDDCQMARYAPDGATGAMDLKYAKAVELISVLEDKL